MLDINKMMDWALSLEPYETSTYMTTVVGCWLFGLVLFAFQRSVLTRERWAYFLSIFFFILGGQYASLLIWQSESYDWSRFLLMVGSTLNNLFAIAAAIALLRKKSPKEIGFQSFFPTWSFMAISLTWGIWFVGFLIGIESYWLSRFPDSLISSCIGLVLGYALFLNINGGVPLPTLKGPKILLFISTMTLISQILYFGLNIIYTCSHIIAPDSHEKLDLLVIIATFPLKFMLFGGGLTVLIQSVALTHSQGIRETLGKFRDERSELLAPGGIVAFLGQNLNPDRVRLLFRRPGRKTLFQLFWSKDEPSEQFLEIYYRSMCQMAKQAFKTGEISICETNAEAKENESEKEASVRKEYVWAIPIVYHGGVVGCLTLVWTKKIQSTMPLVERLEHLAAILAPAVHYNRQLIALKEIKKGFRRAKGKDKKEILNKMVSVLQNILGVPALGICMDIGALPNFAMKIEGGNCKPGPGDISAEALEKMIHKHNPELHCTKAPIRDLENEILWGHLVLGLVKVRDHAEGPTLGTDWLFQEELASLISNSYHDLIRKRHQDNINQFISNLYQEERFSAVAWFEAVEKAADEARIAWVAAQPGAQAPIEGRKVILDRIPCLPEPGKTMGVADAKIAIHHLKKPHHKAWSVLKLEQDETTIWVGIERKQFGNELQPHWTWTHFFEQFVRHAATAVERLKLRQERLRSVEYKNLSAAAVVTGSLVHEIKNMAMNLSSGVVKVKEDLVFAEHPAPDSAVRRLELMTDSLKQLRNVTHSIAEVTKMGSHRPCHLKEAAETARKFTEYAYLSNNIALYVEISSDLKIDMPHNVAVLALTNLISNSIDALKGAQTPSGEIRITAQSTGEIVLCKVTDNGPGIHPNLGNRIFELNVTSKPGSRGDGLYLTRRTLKDEDGDISVTSTEKGRTEITISFPKPMNHLRNPSQEKNLTLITSQG